MFHPLSLFKSYRTEPAAVAENATRDPWLRLQHEVNRLFDEAVSGIGITSTLGMPSRFPAALAVIRLDVRENDKAIEIDADLPGVDEADLSVEVSDNVLTIRGEKKVEREGDRDQYRLVERTYGSFARSLSLPFEVDPDRVEGVFRNGVLKLTLPKPPESQTKTRRIEIKRD